MLIWPKKVEHYKLKKHKLENSRRHLDIDEILVSSKVSFGEKGFKDFIGCREAKKIRPLCIFLPKMNACRKDFDKTKCVSFLIKDDKLLEKYNKICEKVSNAIKKEFGNNPVYNKKILEN